MTAAGVSREQLLSDPEPAVSAEAEQVREPVAVLADCMETEGGEDSASEVRRRALVNADHLGILHSRWADLAGRADRERYRQLVLDALPEPYRPQDLGPQATWLYRTLRAAEMAGLDAGEVVRATVSARPLAGARNVAAVLDARMRRITDPLVPLPQKPWHDRAPQITDGELRDYAAELTQAMDARAGRLGEHAAETSPAWAVQALGPVPDHPVDRLDWQHRASTIATYREVYGIDDDGELIGPEPTGNAPEMRAAWHAAFAVITRTDSVDVRALPDSSLVHMRDSYRTETGWAPPHVGRQLREVRLGAETMRLRAIRAQAEAHAATSQAVAARHASIAHKARVLEARYREHEAVLDEVMQDRRVWDKLTQGSRQLAVQADSEIRRRYPHQKIKPLASAEPKAPDEPLAAPGWLAELDEQRRAFREELLARQNVVIPAEDPDWQDEGQAWPVWEAQRDAILQPPKPELAPSQHVLEAARQRDTAREAV